jgi:hypothetical protein
MEDRKVRQILFGGWYQWEGGEYEERVCESEYGWNTMYSCMKMEKWHIETILRMGEGE